MKKVLVIAVHPDDETLGCGGTILKHIAAGDQVEWLICTTLDMNSKYFSKRQSEIQKVKEAFGFSAVHELKMQTVKLKDLPFSNVIDLMSSKMKEICPEVVYCPFVNDIHTDHKVIFEAIMSCTKSFRYPSVKKVLMMETVSETEFAPAISGGGFIPNQFVDISAYLDKKIEIMKIYESEMGEHPFPRSELTIRSLAHFRGAIAGCYAAESFVIVREIV